MPARRRGRKGNSGDGVGFGRPPVDHQFTKGKSGNPLGRRRKQPEGAFEMAARLLAASHAAPNGRSTTLREVTVTRAVQELAAGKMRSANFLSILELVDTLDTRQAARSPDEVTARLAELSEVHERGNGGASGLTAADVYLSGFEFPARRLFDWLAYGKKLLPCEHWMEVTTLLDGVSKGFYPRLVLNLPPQSLKTFLCSISLPLVALLHRPSARILVLVQSDEMVEKLRSHYDQLVASYPPDLPVEGKLRLVDGVYSNAVGGIIQVATFGRPVAENGIDLCVLDDPQSLHEAGIPRLRNRAHDAVNEYVVGKLSAKGSVVLVQSRLHVDDLSGRLAASTSNTQLLAAEPVRNTGWFRYFRGAARQAGVVMLNGSLPPEVLCRDLVSAEQLYARFQEVGVGQFSARWLQRPLPEGLPASTIMACRQIERNGETKFAQEAEEMVVSAEQLVNYQTFGLTSGWVMPGDHPARLTEKERETNRVRRLQYIKGLRAGKTSREEYEEANWALL